MRKTIERLELNNYRLYVFISLLIGVILFVITFFIVSKVSLNFENTPKNKADEIMKVTHITDIGFDIEIESPEEVKVRYFFGKTKETMLEFFQSNGYVKSQTQQFRSIVPDTNNFVQIEVEDKKGEKIKSQIINVNDMIK
ncbi:MAG: hypothetical protein EBV07_01580 [Proteobacteria bacterium]|nr:hypothetical protein [Pseudomonadota bacterium]